MAFKEFNDVDSNGLNDVSQPKKQNKFDMSDSDEIAEQLEREELDEGQDDLDLTDKLERDAVTEMEEPPPELEDDVFSETTEQPEVPQETQLPSDDVENGYTPEDVSVAQVENSDGQESEGPEADDPGADDIEIDVEPDSLGTSREEEPVDDPETDMDISDDMVAAPDEKATDIDEPDPEAEDDIIVHSDEEVSTEHASVDEPDESYEAETEPVVHEQVELSSEPAPPEEEQNAPLAMEVRNNGTDAPEQPIVANVEQAPATEENGHIEQPEGEQPLRQEVQPPQETNNNEKAPEEPNVVGASDQTRLHEGGDHPDDTKQPDTGNETTVAEPEQPISVDQSEKTDSDVANPDEALKNAEEAPASVDEPDESHEAETEPAVQEQVEPPSEPTTPEEERNAQPMPEGRDDGADAPEQPVATNVEHVPATEENGHIEQPEGEQPMLQEEQPSQEMNTIEKAPEEPPKNIEEEPASVDEPDGSHEEETEPTAQEQVELSSEPASQEKAQNANPMPEGRDGGTDAPEQPVAANVEQAPAAEENGRMEQPEGEQLLLQEEQPPQETNTNEKAPEEPNVVGASDQIPLHEGGEHPDDTKQPDTGNETTVAEPEQPISVDQSEKTDTEVANPDQAPKNVEEPPASVDEPDETQETETGPTVQEQVEPSFEPAYQEEAQNAHPAIEVRDGGTDAPEQPIAANAEHVPATDESGRIEQPEGEPPLPQEVQPPQETNNNEKAPEEPDVVGASDQTRLHEGGDHPDGTKQPGSGNETAVAEPEQPISVDQSEKTDTEVANPDQAPKNVEEVPASVEPVETKEPEQSNIPDDAQAEQQKADAEKLQEVSEKTEVDATTPTSLEDHRNNEEQPPQNTEAPDAQQQNIGSEGSLGVNESDNKRPEISQEGRLWKISGERCKESYESSNAEIRRDELGNPYKELNATEKQQLSDELKTLINNTPKGERGDFRVPEPEKIAGVMQCPDGSYRVKEAWKVGTDGASKGTREMEIVKAKDENGNPTYIDRIGNSNGNYFSPMDANGAPCSLRKRAIGDYLPHKNIADNDSYHLYEVKQDFTRGNFNAAIDRTYVDQDIRDDMYERLQDYYDDAAATIKTDGHDGDAYKYSGEQIDGVKAGTIDIMFGTEENPDGGGRQYIVPFNAKELEKLGMIEEIKKERHYGQNFS